MKIRESEISKVPFIGIVGNNELENKTINIRKYGGDQIGELKLKELTELINNEISGRVGSYERKIFLKSRKKLIELILILEQTK